MYNLKIGGRWVTNLRLSEETIIKIFTEAITSWDDPAIQADNPGLALPDMRIVPVVRSDGAGLTAQFTARCQYGTLWDAYCHRAGRDITPRGATSFYPTVTAELQSLVQFLQLLLHLIPGAPPSPFPVPCSGIVNESGDAPVCANLLCCCLPTQRASADATGKDNNAHAPDDGSACGDDAHAAVLSVVTQPWPASADPAPCQPIA